MRKYFNNQKVITFFRGIKPWLSMFALVLILRYTGALSGISVFAQSALIETGFMDFDPEKNTVPAASFDYNFKLKDLKGNIVDVNKFKGKVLFINLWATWCGPCRAEMPSIQKLYESADAEKVVFIMLALDTEENQHRIPKFISDKQYTFPVYVADQSLPAQLNVSSIPTTFIIGKDGKIESKKAGASNYNSDKFRDYLNSLTKK